MIADASVVVDARVDDNRQMRDLYTFVYRRGTLGVTDSAFEGCARGGGARNAPHRQKRRVEMAVGDLELRRNRKSGGQCHLVAIGRLVGTQQRVEIGDRVR
jgi:hypothetical protein